MKKILLNILPLLLLAAICSSSVLAPLQVHAQAPTTPASPATSAPATAAPVAEKKAPDCDTLDFSCKFTKSIKEDIVPYISYLFLKITSYVAGFAGLLLNFVVKYTVVDMAKHLNGVPGKNIPGIPINEAWASIRDIANMGFIFVLLYAAIQTILGIGGDNQKLIKNIVIAAILINFSLFFTKVFIDFTNIIAITFYDAIAPGALTGSPFTTGLSNSMMQPLHIQSIVQLGQSEVVTAGSVLTIGIMGSIFLLITAFVFYAVSFLFLMRYVILVFVLILSPIAFVSNIIPGLGGPFKQWKDALINQSVFAPVYFLLTWIVVKIFQESAIAQVGSIGAALQGLSQGGDAGALTLSTNLDMFGTIINFFLVIAFLITSLIIAKSMAGKSAGALNKVAGWATGASLGLVGAAGRNTLGSAGATLADNEGLKAAASKAGFVGAASRLALATGRKTSEASFDLRGTGLTKPFASGKAQKGGYAKTVKEDAKKEKEYGEALKPSDIKVDQAKQELERAKNIDIKDPKFKERGAERADRARKMADDLEVKLFEAKRHGATSRMTAVMENDLKALREQAASSTPEEYKKELVKNARDKVDDLTGIDEKEAKKRLVEEEKWDPAELKTDRGKAAIKDMQKKSGGDLRKEQYAQALDDPRWVKRLNPNVLAVSKSNKQAAADLRKGKKPVKDQLEALLKAENEIAERQEETTEAVEDAAESGGSTTA